MANGDNPEDIWNQQYPYGGFCFGPDKPTVHLIQEKGKSIVKFEGSAINGEIRKCVYPDFSLEHWWKFVHYELGDDWLHRLGVEEDSITSRECSPDVLKKLIDGRAPGEKDFLDLYYYFCPFERGYQSDGTWIAPDWIPAPIPQVWIQWHSNNIDELKKNGGHHILSNPIASILLFSGKISGLRFLLMVFNTTQKKRRRDGWQAKKNMPND